MREDGWCYVWFKGEGLRNLVRRDGERAMIGTVVSRGERSTTWEDLSDNMS